MNPIRHLTVFLIIAFTLASTAKASSANQIKNILIIGDSLSAAYNIKQSASWVTLLQQKLKQQHPNYRVANAAISGDTTENALQKLPLKLQQFSPDIIIVEIGGNDGLRGFPINTIKSNLERIVSQAKAHGKVLLVGMQIPPNYGKRYSTAFRDLYPLIAKQHDVSLMPFFLKDVALNNALMQDDGIHPKAEAQPILMKNLWPYLEPLL